MLFKLSALITTNFLKVYLVLKQPRGPWRLGFSLMLVARSQTLLFSLEEPRKQRMNLTLFTAMVILQEA